MATIKDVAALAGISYTTVSHVLNKTRPVSEHVRLKVEAAILELDYVPSAVARSLKARSTATIGLLVPNSVNPYFAELARGIEDACERNGYCVILCNSDDNPQKQRSYLRVLLEKRIDGLVVASVGQDSDLLQSLASVRTPMVIVDRELEGVDADLVRIDHEQGAYLATRHLLELGHRDIAYIGGPAETGVTQLRLSGFRRAMAEAGAGAQVQGNRVLHCDFTSPGGHAAAAQVLEGKRPTAIFAGNDMIGFGVLRAAAERNINVPGELSVIGFDDIELSRYVYPPLTTVGQSIRELGENAASLLLARIAAPRQGAAEQRIVPPRIVLRESTGPRPDLFNDYR
ncbi:LacI family DNA-binding transcriptional regulator [Pseudomonas monteilii]|jgi:LacI family transcriptional regulator|uniref:DNA-binding transcriptional repressor n=1 Tax=Pseudomonas monteilii TaxID=76759 RepID=A0AAE6V2X9_9PSED|nr:LacI family DNA-binding transcriptional regulator [Pseudomonas monteilii]MDD2124854.1 LacI family transcriptional regulator [Pseudomonas monteilii]NBB02842.1 substrate-binding domain-containing protein [Pseudomonas monteilii]QHB28580.1 DNA-binding transcriptional repressor [Pseudomonas monteilii]